MRGINKVILVGHTTRDTELHHTKTDKSVSNIRLATNRSVAGTEETQYHTVICWNKLAEITAQYVKKGRLIYVEGRLQYRKFTGSDGIEKQITEIVADNVQFLDKNAGQSKDSFENLPLAQDAEEINPEDIPF